MVNINTNQPQPIFSDTKSSAVISSSKSVNIQPTNDDILFIGLNPGHKDELSVLKKGAAKTNFKIENISDTENWKIDNFDLKTNQGVSAFIDSLGLTDENQKKELKTIILDIDVGKTEQKASARDEAAAIIKVWSRAEKGESIPSRFAISGHGNSIDIWGDNDRGHISIDSIKNIARAMPKASAQVEDILISACRCGYQDTIQGLQNSFSNLKTVWGYAGTAPLGEYGGAKHVQEWEAKTSGHNSKIDRNQELKILKGVSNYQNIAIWSKDSGYQRGASDTSSNFVETWMRLERYRTGSFDTNNVQDDLNNIYNTIQDLNSTADADYKPVYKIAIEKVNILRHFPEIVIKFDDVIGNDIRNAFKVANLECPELKVTDKNKFIAQFQKKTEMLSGLYQAGKFNDLPADKKELIRKVEKVLSSIAYLDNDFIPQSWLTSGTTDDVRKKILDFYNKPAS